MAAGATALVFFAAGAPDCAAALAGIAPKAIAAQSSPHEVLNQLPRETALENMGSDPDAWRRGEKMAPLLSNYTLQFSAPMPGPDWITSRN